ncbi:hypothetical protein DFQ30_001280, partial [Apophysomyces sp. BC1015]
RERHRRFRARIACQQQRLRQRNHRPGDRALQHARREQERQRRRQPAQPRRNHEQHDRGEEQPDLPDALGQPAGQWHGDRVGDRERRDDPRTLVRRHAEVARDGRDRDVRD